MKCALFIKGHNTFGVDNYRVIERDLNAQDIVMTYIDYELEEDISSVYKRICKLIKHDTFDFLIGHSMGGTLLYNYISKHPNKISKFKKCILLMPLLHKDCIINAITKIPRIDTISLPKALIYPKNNLYNGGHIWNDIQNTKMIPLKQISQCYDLLPNDNEIIKTINKHPNCDIFYATEEKFTIIPEETLHKINNIHIIDGKHELFKDCEKAPAFFNELRKCIITSK